MFINLWFQLLVLFIICLSVINLVRMTLFLIGADIYNLLNHKKFRKNNYSSYQPKISVVIPAFNEELSIIQCIESVLKTNYPKEKLEVIVVNDGSTDKTLQLIKNYTDHNSDQNLIVVDQTNSGKAHALNNGIQNYATGELVMCLDADSYIDENILVSIVKYFHDQKVMAVASNVKISHSKEGLLHLIQQFEYIVCYQMKRAQSLYNIEYIIGGIGSTFRKSYLEKIGYYDSNTVTEDIDLTMKILRQGNKKIRVIYASDAVVYTQGVLNIKDLVKQRYRWKWGRYQTFLKNKSMFFSSNWELTKGLSWIYLPFALWSDFIFLFEPLILVLMLCIVIFFNDPITLLTSFGVLTFYLSMNILAEETIPFKQKAPLLLLAPGMYVFFYLLSYVEYLALIKSLVRLPTLRESLSNNLNSWTPVKRVGYSLGKPKH